MVTKVHPVSDALAVPITPSRSVLQALVSAARSPLPLQACSPPPHRLEGTLEGGDQAGKQPEHDPRMCT